MGNILRQIATMEFGERLLAGGALVGATGVLFPWISGEWLGGTLFHATGFQFYTATMGTAIFLLNILVLGITIIPRCGGPSLIRQERREIVRLLAASLAVILTLAALSVLTNITFEFSRMGVRFGVYVCLLGNLFAAFEAFCKWQEQEQRSTRAFFHYPEVLPPSPPPEEPLSPSSLPHAYAHRRAVPR